MSPTAIDAPDGRFLVGGVRTRGAGRHAITDPYRREPITEIEIAGPAHIDAAVSAARRAQPGWAATPIHARSAVLRKAADLVAARKDTIARTISRQTGKALRDTRREVDRGAYTLRAAAAAIEQMGGEVAPAEAVPGGEGLLALVLREALGVVAAISPFNAPFNLAMHKVAAALAVGNAVVLKPSSNAPLTGYQQAELLYDAGLPPEALSVLAGGPDVGTALAQHAGVDAVSFTGSRNAGLALLRAAGLKKVLLELGGNSPNLVHGDADLEWAAGALVPGAFSNTGQSCNSVQRILIERRVFDALAEQLVARARNLIVGDPLDERTDVGTMVTEAAAERLTSWVDEAVAAGATRLLGGAREHALVQPILLRDVDPAMRIVCEEAFGPVAVLIAYDDLDEAIAVANSTEYGLQSAVFTGSLDVAFRAARGIRAGGVMVNRSSNFRIDNLPFGGVKSSGLSREGGRYTLEEMTERKLILIDHALAGAPHPLSAQKR